MGVDILLTSGKHPSFKYRGGGGGLSLEIARVCICICVRGTDVISFYDFDN